MPRDRDLMEVVVCLLDEIRNLGTGVVALTQTIRKGYARQDQLLRELKALRDNLPLSRGDEDPVTGEHDAPLNMSGSGKAREFVFGKIAEDMSRKQALTLDAVALAAGMDVVVMTPSHRRCIGRLLGEAGYVQVKVPHDRTYWVKLFPEDGGPSSRRRS